MLISVRTIQSGDTFARLGVIPFTARTNASVTHEGRYVVAVGTHNYRMEMAPKEMVRLVHRADWHNSPTTHSHP